MTEQPTLPIQPLAVDTLPADLTIQERFERFHELNPWVFEAYETLTADWLARGHKRIGVGMLTEVIRYEYARQTRGDGFKVNNNFRSRYVRLLIAEHPEWAEAFETRKLRAA